MNGNKTFSFSLYDCSVVSGSRDSTLRMWDIKTGQCVHVLVGHVAAVRCVQYDGHRVRTMYTTTMCTQTQVELGHNSI